MCHRFDFDNCISLIGAWFLFLFSFGFFYFIWSLVEFFHMKKYSIYESYASILKSSLNELLPSYWWSC